MSDYDPPQPIIFPPIFNTINWPPFEDQVVSGGGGGGAQGPQGTQGTGGIGNQGFQGRQGNQGFQGVAGTNGTSGTQGSQGLQGTQGTNGLQGNQGSQGLVGSTGAQGPQGTQGSQGFQGTAGATGATGSWGPFDLQIFTSFTDETLITAGSTAGWRNLNQTSRIWNGVCMNSSGSTQIITATDGTSLISRDYGSTFNTLTVSNGTENVIAMSASGQYIAIAGAGAASGIALSSNYGTSFTSITTPFSGVVYGLAMSASGNYIYVQPASPGTLLYRSADFGTTWTSTTLYANNHRTVSCSKSGQYVCVGREGGASSISHDFGATFPYLGVPGHVGNAMNATGQYIFNSGDGFNASISRNYGVSWTAIGTYHYAGWSSSGHFLMLGYSNGITISQDYGNTFSLVYTGISTAWNRQSPGLALSGNGKFALVSINSSGSPHAYRFPEFDQFDDPINWGFYAGTLNQSAGAVAIGYQAGQNFQSTNSVAIGNGAGMTGQGSNAVAIGSFAGGTAQGANCVAIGFQAGFHNQTTNSIVLNATPSALSAGTTGFFVKPIRDGPTGSIVLSYNNTSGEIYYTQRSAFAQYFDTTDQANSGATGNTITFNTTDFERGISLVSSSRITVPETGYYSLSYSLQYINTNNTEQYIDVWFEKNGTTILSNSNSVFGIARNQNTVDGKLIASSTFFFNLVKNDYLELRWFCSTTDVDLEYIVAGTYIPATPSAFVNIQLISS